MKHICIALILALILVLTEIQTPRAEEPWRVSLLAYRANNSDDSIKSAIAKIDTSEELKRSWIANDSWFSRDKAEHLVRDFLIYTILFKSGLKRSGALQITLAFNTLSELKDMLFDWRKYGWWGGDGFSPKDWLAGAIGTGLAYHLIR